MNMIGYLLIALAFFIIGYVAGVHYAAKNHAKMIAPTFEAILTGQGYTVKGGRIVKAEDGGAKEKASGRHDKE